MCKNGRKKDEPEFYLAWHCWADRKVKTHYQVKCKKCGYYHIWKKRKKKKAVKNEYYR